MNRSSISISEGRLQRASQNPSIYISKFRQVLLRHGMTMSLIFFGCLLFPVVFDALFSSLDKFFLNINRYAFVSLGLSFFMFLYLKIFSKELSYRQTFWIIYLLFISIIEEIGFRVSLPILFSDSFFKRTQFFNWNFFKQFAFCISPLFYFALEIESLHFYFSGWNWVE